MVIRTTVRGSRKVQRRLESLDLKIKDLSDAWDDIGDRVVRDARPLTPVLTGKLLSTLRAGGGKSKAVVRAGNNRMPPYGPIQHYGGYNNIEGKYFLSRALSKNVPYITGRIDDEIEHLIRTSGLRRR